jgi:hypothetical protein
MSNAVGRKSGLYILDYRYGSVLSSYEIVNKNFIVVNPSQLPSTSTRSPAECWRQNGLWRVIETPVIKIRSPCKICKRDIDIMYGFWIISDRCKAVLSSVDEKGFEYMECHCLDKDGKLIDIRWLCDAVRVLDVLDEHATNIKVTHHSNGMKSMLDKSDENLVFDRSLIPSECHVFRMFQNYHKMIIDEEIKSALKGAGMTNFLITDVSKRDAERKKVEEFKEFLRLKWEERKNAGEY